MPLVYQQDINSETKLGVWMITEPFAFFKERVEYFNIIRHHQKQLQHLAGRNLLRELHPDLSQSSIVNNTFKVNGSVENSLNYSVSHSVNYAVVITGSGKRVGIDIELPSEKAYKLKDKFLSIEEFEVLQGMMQDDVHAATAGWCIKEAVFKWYGKGRVDFINHINIVRAMPTKEEMLFDCVFAKESECLLRVKLIYVDKMILVWVIL